MSYRPNTTLNDQFTSTGGGGATETYTCAGMATTGSAIVQINDDGTNNVTLVRAWASAANTLSVTYSGDPAADTIISATWEV